MPVIVRPTKASGNTTYVEETAAGKLDIIDEELDRDFFNLYTGINRLDNDNIQPGSPGQRIVYEKLNLTGKITAADLAPGAAGGNLGPTSIDKTQMKIGATVWDQQASPVNDSITNIAQSNIEQLVAETTWTSRGGFFLVWAKLIGGYPVAIGSPYAWHTHLRIDGTAGNPNDGTIIDYGITRVAYGINAYTGDLITFPISHAMLAHGVLASAGVHRLKLTVTVEQITVAGFPYVEDRRIVVMESA